jgi:hypothetical protein
VTLRGPRLGASKMLLVKTLINVLRPFGFAEPPISSH